MPDDELELPHSAHSKSTCAHKMKTVQIAAEPPARLTRPWWPSTDTSLGHESAAGAELCRHPAPPPPPWSRGLRLVLLLPAVVLQFESNYVLHQHFAHAGEACKQEESTACLK